MQGAQYQKKDAVFKIMKYVREHINEKFKEVSDPIEDMEIGYDWRLITKGTILPEDFVDEEGRVNRKNYIIERGFADDPSWLDEYSSTGFNLEQIGAIILGSKNYAPVRYRRRKSTDKPWDVTQSWEYQQYKLMSKQMGWKAK